ncbi:MAG: hypothetical protein K8R21_13135 [Leptospira sp.]|nr:hypothetical protein [Leptospira sp.]
MKKVALMISTCVFLMSSAVFAVSSELENFLIAKSLLQSASNNELKSVVSKYLSSLASEDKNLASAYRESASVRRGGKSVAQDVKAKDLLAKAESLESEANLYQSLITEGRELDIIKMLTNQKRSLANSYSEISKISHGGKAATQESNSRKYAELSRKLNEEVKSL